MPENRPDREEGIVFSSIDELLEVAEEREGPWPQLDEPNFSSISPNRSNFAERVGVWTMAGLLGAVTIYAIATGDREVLFAILTIAAGALIRFTRLTSGKNKRGEKDNDPRSKRRRKKRPPG